MKTSNISNKRIYIFTSIAIQLICASFSYSETTFTQVSNQAGVAQISNTWGVSVGDVNNDGFQDIFVSNHMYRDYYQKLIHPTLFLNNGGLNFQDVTDVYGIMSVGDFHGASFADYNNDGFLDLFQTQGGGGGVGQEPNYLYKNSSNGSFQEIGESAGLDNPKDRGRIGFWYDYDLDGLLDIFLCNDERPDHPSILMKNNGDDTFTDAGLITITDSVSMGTPLDYNNDHLIDVFLMNRTTVFLYENDGNGGYLTPREVKEFFGLRGFAWGDYDNDGDLDLYLACSSLSDALYSDSNNIYFRKTLKKGEEKGLNFTIIANDNISFDFYTYAGQIPLSFIRIGSQGFNPQTMPFTLVAGAPEVQGQPDTVGFKGCAVWEDNGTWKVRCTVPDGDNQPRQFISGVIQSESQVDSVIPFNYTDPRSACKNSLFENKGNGEFVDVAAGVADTSNSMSAVWGDFDNDGFLDLYVVNTGEIFNAPNRLYMNNGDKTFTDSAAFSRVKANVTGRGENAVTADFDNDGFLDLFVVNGFGPAPFSFGPHLLYKNNGNANHWLKVKLEGNISNRDAIGAKVTARVGQTIYTRQQTGGVGRYSQSSQIIHFGLASNTTIDDLTIYWPNGTVQTLNNLSADQFITISEP